MGREPLVGVFFCWCRCCLLCLVCGCDQCRAFQTYSPTTHSAGDGEESPELCGCYENFKENGDGVALSGVYTLEEVSASVSVSVSDGVYTPPR